MCEVLSEKPTPLSELPEAALPTSGLKGVFLVDELAERWEVSPERIRILIRERKLKTLRGLKPYRITYKDVREYEELDDFSEFRSAFFARRKAGKR